MHMPIVDILYTIMARRIAGLLLWSYLFHLPLKIVIEGNIQPTLLGYNVYWYKILGLCMIILLIITVA